MTEGGGGLKIVQICVTSFMNAQLNRKRYDAMRKWTMVVPDVRSDPVVQFDLEKVEFISRPASVIYTIDSNLMEDWKHAVINLQGGPTITPAYIENGVQVENLKHF